MSYFAFVRRASLAGLVAGVLVSAACADATSPPSSVSSANGQASSAKSVNQKLSVTGVTLTDADQTTFTDAVINASSKNGGQGGGTTTCDYATTNGTQSLGQFEANTFISDPDALRQFCIDNFAVRQVR